MKFHERKVSVTPADDAPRAGRVSLGQPGAPLANFLGDPTKSAWNNKGNTET